MKLALPAFAPSGKTAIVLGFALVVGVIAALAANRFLASHIEAIEARSRGATVEVVVARQALSKGQTLNADLVAVRNVPLDYAHSNALTQQGFAKMAGRKLAYDMQAGEMLLASLLQTPKPATFSARVEPGRRAMTVAVDEINSISGLLEPGDMIDLLAGLERKGRKLSVPLLQGVQVMATGQRAVDDPLTGERRQYATVTLDLTPAQAAALIAARDGGRLTALLRNPQDRPAVSGEAADLAALLGEAGGAAEVPVLYGGGAGKLPADALWLDAYKTASEAMRNGAGAAPVIKPAIAAPMPGAASPAAARAVGQP